MKTLFLTQNRVALVDDADYPFVSQFSWSARKSHAGHWYAYASVNGKVIGLHQLLTQNPLTDHKNRNGLDNRRCNLRKADYSQNGANQKCARHNTSGLKGVTWHKAARKWLAQIQVNGKKIYLGLHKSINTAKAAYDTAALNYFGEFARL